MNKIAAEPRHLEIEFEEVKVNANKEECNSNPKVLSNK